MKFTFGIPTVLENRERMIKIIESIKAQNIPEYEIIIVGGEDIYQGISNIRFVQFDESIKSKWITRKKNIIAEIASYDNIVLFHDYYEFIDGWYSGYIGFGEDWDICQNICLDIDGNRYYDWVAWDHPYYPKYSIVQNNEDSKNLYVPGHYFLAKKKVLLETPLNEALIWGESEDIDWTNRIRDKNYRYRMNSSSVVKHLKKYRGYIEK